MKELRVTMPDGSVWAVPAAVIAGHRAQWYADNHGEPFQDEFDEAMEDDHVLKDWAAGDMNWDDVKDIAQKHSDPPEPDYQEGWVNGSKAIKDIADE